MTFREHDLLQPFPKDLLGKYDVVHKGFMCFAINGDEWERAVKSLVALLSMCPYCYPDLNVIAGYRTWGSSAVGRCRHRDISSRKDRYGSEHSVHREKHHDYQSISIGHRQELQVSSDIYYDDDADDKLTRFTTPSCIERLQLTFREQGLDDTLQTHVASDATPTTKIHFNAAMRCLGWNLSS